MRYTSFMIYDQVVRSLQQGMENYAKFQTQLATGKKINQPSDDPIALGRAMDYRLSIGRSDQYQRNITATQNQFSFLDTVFSSASKALQSLKDITTSATGGLTTDEMTTFAGQAGQLRDQLLSLGNSTYNDSYVFSGYKTDTAAFDPATYSYQGDAGVMSVMIGGGYPVAVNVTGDNAFASVQTTPETVQITGGRYVHYTSGGGTKVNVEIRDTDDATVLDQFSFSNYIQMADVITTALQTNDTMRIEAMANPAMKAVTQINTVQAEFGSRGVALKDEADRLSQSSLSLQNALSATEDADATQTITEMNKAYTALQALQQSSTRILSQSLMDYLD